MGGIAFCHCRWRVASEGGGAGKGLRVARERAGGFALRGRESKGENPGSEAADQ